MLPGAKQVDKYAILKSWIPSVILIPVCLYFITTRGEYTLVDQFELFIHEAGHFLLAWGWFPLEIAGGTIMQIIIPILLIIFTYVNFKRLYLQLAFFFLGHNFLNISVYAADATAMKLDLFPRKGVVHDWNYMLSNLNLLEQDQNVALFFVVMAVISFLLAILVPLHMKA